jgi:membrane-associated protease RseP (regulator of RpoE activity)
MQARLPPAACLGLTARNVRELDAETTSALDVGSGVLIGEVSDDGPAQRAGLAPWDVVLGIDGAETPDLGDLRRVLHGREPGERVSLLVSRKGETLSPSLVLGERDDEGGCRARGGTTETAEPAVPTPVPDRLVFKDVVVRPQPVPAGAPFDVELAVEVADSSAASSEVEVTLRVEILRDGEVLYEPAPKRLSCRNGGITEVIKHLRAGSEPGSYELRLTATAGQLRDQRAVVFEIR